VSPKREDGCRRIFDLYSAEQEAKYTFNRSIRTFFTGGSRPSITFFSASRLECKLSGALVPAGSNVSPPE
jgi:hypothetical protein